MEEKTAAQIEKEKLEIIKSKTPYQRLSYACFDLRPRIKPSTYNDFYKKNGKGSGFIELDKLLEACSGVLRVYGLDIFSSIEIKDGHNVLITEVVDLLSKETKPEPIRRSFFQLTKLNQDGNIIHKEGGQITYMRRYNIMTILNISTDKDDDGNKANPTPSYK